jgi:hypothetical protein
MVLNHFARVVPILCQLGRRIAFAFHRKPSADDGLCLAKPFGNDVDLSLRLSLGLSLGQGLSLGLIW